MTLATQTLTLDLRPAYNTRGVVRCSQYDDELRTVTFLIQNAGVDVDVSAYTVFIEGTKPDNTGFSYNVRDIGGTVQVNAVTVPIQVQMCALAGMVRAEVIFKNGSERVGSANFFIAVEAAGLDANIDISETEIPAYISAAEQAAETAQQAQQAAQQILDTSDQALLAAQQAEQAAQQAELIAQGALDQAEETAESIPSDYTELSNDVDDLKSNLYTIEGGVINGLFVGSNIKTSGATTSNTARLRTNRMSRAGREVVKLANGGYEYCAFGYSDEGYSDWQNTYLGENTGWINGAYPLYIPDTYEYYALTFRRVDLANVSSTDADAISSTIKTYNTEVSHAIIDELNYLVPVGNNLIPLKDFHGVVNGVTIDINNGVLSLRGTSTGYIRAKLSGGFYELNYNARQEWATERLSGFESGEYYSFHNEILYGTLPSSAGASLRDDSGSVILSASVPQTLLSATPAYVMLYIPTQTNVNVDFIPMIIKGTLDAKASSRILNKSVHISAEQILDLKTYEMPDLSANFVYDSTLESAMKFPSAYAVSGEPTPLIILCHGLDSTISSSSWGGTDMTNLVNGFVENGFAVIDVNQVTTQDWCNPSLIEKYVKAITDAVTRYNVEPKIIFAESMGGLIGLCLSTLYHEVKALVVSGLRLDLSARYADLTAEQQAIVDANLGFTNGYDAYIAAGWDKCAIACVDANGNGINPNQFPPTLFVVGTTDTYNTESLQKVDEIKRGGTICKTSEYEGNHNAVSYLKAGTSFTDAIAWMNKWC